MGDSEWMKAAIARARAGLGATYPNPCVGAVIVARGRVIAGGRSGPTGTAHAEVRALAKAGSAAAGSTLVVTLEPCAHQGRTGPCTRAIIEAGVARVIVGVRDPAPHVDGRGLRALRRAGVEVVLRKDSGCAQIHEHYLHHVQTGVPFVSLKVATSLDGRIATPQGDSRWITSEVARRHGHRLRAQHHAIAVGAQTVRIDDPRLDVRWVRGVDPVVVVFDSRLSLGGPGGPRPRVLRPGTLVLHTARASARAKARVAATGATPLRVAANDAGQVDIGAALRALGRREIRSLLVEGGGRLHGSFVAAAAWQRGFVHQAPRILGEGRPAFGGVQWATVAEAPQVTVTTRRRLGPDQLIVIEPRSNAAAG